MHRLVREHRRSGNIADGKDVRHIGPHLLVHRNVATIGNGDACCIGANNLAIGYAADGHQHAIVNGRCRSLLALEGHAQTLGQGLNASDLRAQQNLLVPSPNPLFQRPDQVGIATGHELRGQFHHTHTAAHSVVHARHLQTDDAAADDQQAAAKLRKLERIARVHDARIGRQPGKTNRFRACRDDALIEADALGAAASHHFDDVRADETTDTLHDLDLALLRQQAQSAGQLVDDRLLPRPERGPVDLRGAERDAFRAHLFDFFDDLRRVQQRFGGNAPDVQTNPAEARPALDQGDLQSQVGGAECRRVPARARAEHQNLSRAIEFAVGAILARKIGHRHAHRVAGTLVARGGRWLRLRRRGGGRAWDDRCRA